MAAFVQSNQAASSSATSLNCSFLSNVGAAGMIVTGARVGASGRTVTVTDSFGTLAQAVTQAQTTDGHQAYAHFEASVAGGADTVAFGISGAAASIRYSIHEYSAMGASTVDQTNSAQWTTGSVDSGSVTTTQANELLFGLLTDDNAQSATWSPTISPSAWSSRESVSGGADICVYTDDLFVSSTGVYSNLPVKSAGLTNNGTTLIVTFKVGGAAPAATFASVRAFQEPDAFQPQAFQRPDPTDAFITRLHRFFQENAFQRPDPTGVFQFQGFDDEGFQSDAEAFADLVWQPDAFQIDEPLGLIAVSGVGAIASAQAFGVPRVMRLPGPAGIVSAESFGVPDVVRWLGPGGIASLTAFGTTKAMRLLYPLGISSAQAFGVTRLLSPQWVTGVGAISSLEAFGTTKVVRWLEPSGIASAQAFGVAAAQRLLAVTGIGSAQAFGAPKAMRLIQPIGVTSAESFGTAKVIRLIFPAGIATVAAIGTPTVGPFVPSPLIIGGSVNLTDVVLYSVGLADGFILSALVTDLLLRNEPAAADGALYSVTVTDSLLRSEDSSDGI